MIKDILLFVCISSYMLNASDYSQDEAENDMAYAFGQMELLAPDFQNFSAPDEMIFDSAELNSEQVPMFNDDIQTGLNKADVGLSPAVDSADEWVMVPSSAARLDSSVVKIQKMTLNRPASVEPIRAAACMLLARKLTQSH